MPNISFVMDEVDWEAELGSKLLDAAKESGSSIPFGCTNGVCGTCMVKVVSGEQFLESIDRERELQTLEMFGAGPDFRLACQCMIQGDATIDNP